MRGLSINDLHAAARACERCSVIDARHDELASREWWELRARLLRTATAAEESSAVEALARAMEEVTQPLVDEIERLQARVAKLEASVIPWAAREWLEHMGNTYSEGWMYSDEQVDAVRDALDALGRKDTP